MTNGPVHIPRSSSYFTLVDRRRRDRVLARSGDSAYGSITTFITSRSARAVATRLNIDAIVPPLKPPLDSPAKYFTKRRRPSSPFSRAKA